MSDIKIIKPGNSGFGFLIESDAGYISPQDSRNKPFISEVKKLGQGQMSVNEPYIVYVVLQKHTVKNRNGRIYPKHILERENNRYQELIQQRRAIGELDHPECHRESAEVLTLHGWKLIKDISDNEMIFTLNPETNEIEVKEISKKIIKPYKGKMVSLVGRSIDLQVTPNHKFWVIDRYNKGRFITAMDIHENKLPGISKMYIPKTGNWVGDDSKIFTIKGLNESEIAFNCPYNKKIKLMSDIQIPMDLWVKFLGIYLADGSVSASKVSKRISRVTEKGENEYGFESPKSGYICKITQKKESSKELIRTLLDLLPLDFREVNFKSGKVDFIINDARLHKYLHKLGKSHDKFIPEDIKNLNKDLLTDFLGWFIIGDGRVRDNYSEVFSTSKKLIDDLQEIILKTGKSGNLRIEDRNYDRYFGDRLIKKSSSKDINRINISESKGIYLDKRFLKTELVDYDDNVYCVEVPNHIFYVRDQGKACWNGNSSIIAGDRISHTIIETWWEGKTLMGKMEILMTPGYVNYGIVSTKGDEVANLLRNNIMIGVSSRGVGSLNEVNGTHIVQEDFEIICWDVVTSPSTPGSWMFKDKMEAKPFTESTLEKGNLIVDKINKFLLN